MIMHILCFIVIFSVDMTLVNLGEMIIRCTFLTLLCKDQI